MLTFRQKLALAGMLGLILILNVGAVVAAQYFGLIGVML
jgi:hypothetical protein